MFSFTTNFLWDLLALSTEVPHGPGHSSDVRDRLHKVFDLRRRVAKAYQPLSGEKVDPDEDEAQTRPYSAQILDIFELGAGGDPDLPTDLRAASALQDKTSIVLNTLGTGLAVVAAPKADLTEEECMKRLMMIGLAADDPTSLCTLGEPFRASASPEVVSWLCKPTNTDLGSGSMRRQYLPRMLPVLTECIRIDLSPTSRWITLDMLALPPPQPPSERHRTLASTLTQKAIEMGMGRGPPGLLGDLGREYVGKTDVKCRLMLMTIDATNEWGVGPLYQYWHGQTFLGTMREKLNWAVACLMDCGIKWTLGMATKCGYPNPTHLEENFQAYFCDDSFSSLADMSWVESEVGREAFNALYSAAFWVVCWGTTRPRPKSHGYMPMLFGHGLAGKAIVFTVADALVQVVMPGPLLPDEYSRLYRIWLLQAKDDPFYEKMSQGAQPEWFLRSKALLFTDVDARDTVLSVGSAGDGRPGWRLREGVTVHGPPEGFQSEEDGM